jgi:hypothetical protein
MSERIRTPRLLARLAAALSILLLFASASAAQECDLEAMRARWEAKSQFEKQQLRQRFEALRRMSPEERAELHERAGRFRAFEERVFAELPASLRAELARLDREDRQRLLQEHVTERFRERGRRMRGKMPGHFLERLEGASPEERLRMVHRFRSEMRERKGPCMLRRLGGELGLSSEEIERIGSLPPEERHERMRSLRGQRHGPRGPYHGERSERGRRSWHREEGRQRLELDEPDEAPRRRREGAGEGSSRETGRRPERHRR